MTTKKWRMKTRMNSPRRIACVLLALGLCLAAAAESLAQKLKPGEPYALIFGTVFGPDNRAVAGVPIKIRRADQKKPKWELVSDRRGEFAQRFPAGAAEYVFTTHLDKKYGLENKELKVKVTNDERMDIALHLTKAETTEKKK